MRGVPPALERFDEADTNLYSKTLDSLLEEGDVRALMERIRQARMTAMRPLELACKTVLDLGYRAIDCVIEHRPHMDGVSTTSTLKVNGMPCYELVACETHRVDGYVDIRTTCRALTWPKRIA